MGAVAKLDCDGLCYAYWRVIVLYWQWHLHYYGRLVGQLVGWIGGWFVVANLIRPNLESRRGHGIMGGWARNKKKKSHSIHL